MGLSYTTKLLLSCLVVLAFVYYYLYYFHHHQNHSSKLLPPSSSRHSPPNNSFINLSLHHHHFSPIFTNILLEKKVTKMKSSLEDGLARARAAIRRAAQTQSCRSAKQETFIPRGPIYRNPYAFQQSHIEMVKRFKIWTYKEGERPLVHQGPMSSIYGIEGHFIDTITMEADMKKKNKFFTGDPNEAHAFFLPFSVTNMVTVFYKPLVSYNRGPIFRVVLDYINVLAHKYPYWNRSHGADHFMLSCHDWAPEIPSANPKLLKNLIRALCNANTSEGFEPTKDVSIPEVYIPRGKLNPPSLGLKLSRRTIFAFFAGGNHGHVRKYLFNIWNNKDKEIQIYDYLPKNMSYSKMLGQSKFCLCPSGYEVASPRIVEAIFAECVPVIIKDDYAFPFGDVLDWSKFSIYIPKARIPEIKMILKGISTEKYLKLLQGVKSVKWHFTLNRPAQPFDLIHMILHSVWLRRLNIRLPLI